MPSTAPVATVFAVIISPPAPRASPAKGISKKQGFSYFSLRDAES
jgi:hypothetical protein